VWKLSVMGLLSVCSLPLNYALVQVRILVKYAFFGKKIRVQDLLVEHVMNHHLA
jgi:hypothetical protein